MIRVADYIMNRLANLKIKQVFFLPGGGAMHLNDALARHHDIEPVLCLHEQACGIAAEGAAKLQGGPSACLVTSGPGATNVITATLGAWLDSSPVFFISGQVKTSDLKTGTDLRMLGVQETDIVTIVKSITKMAITLTDPNDIGYVFDLLENAALTGRRGPVWLDVPLDVQAMQIDPVKLSKNNNILNKQITNTNKTAIASTIKMLQVAERPVILVGNGVRSAKAESLITLLIEQTGIPIQTSWLGMDLISDNHPLYAGRPGAIAPRWANFTLQNSDCLLIIGCRLDMALTAYSHSRFARCAKKIMVDIDPAEIKKMNMSIDVPIVSDAYEFIQELLDELGRMPALPSYESWLNTINKWKNKYPLIQPEHRQSKGELSLYRFTDILSELLDSDDIIATGSAGFTAELFLLALKLKAGQRCFHNRGTGAMGFGLPAAIGACLASGRRRTICIEGDGGLQMNVQELSTLAAKDLPIKCFIINNGGYASIRASQQNYFKRQIGADNQSGLLLPNLEYLCKAYGIKYFQLRNGTDLVEQIKTILSTNGPLLCEVFVLNNEPRIPRVATKQLENGKMVSSPLEDLYPFLPTEELKEIMFIPLLDE